MTIQVENNFLTNKEYFITFKKITDNNFPWFLDKNSGNFFHNLVEINNNKNFSSPFISLLSPIVNKLKIIKIIKADLNLYVKTKSIVEEKPNDIVDIYDTSLTSYYFFNNANGYFQLTNYEVVDYQENRILTLPSNFSRFKTSHTDIDYNIILTIKYNI